MNTNHVKLNGQQMPVKFGFNALIEFSELTNRTIEQLENLNMKLFTMRDLVTLCWCGLKEGARKEGKEFAFTVQDVGDWLDDSPTAIVDITREYTKSRTPDPDHPSLKKNQPGKRKP